MIIEQLLKTSSVQRLKGLIENRYGKQLRIQAMADVSDLSQLDKSHLFAGKDLRIPISSNDKYMCTAIVADGAGLGSEEAVSISHLVRMILEPIFYDFYLEQKRENAQGPTNPVGNLVTVEELDMEMFRVEMEFEKTRGQVLFLMAGNPSQISRAAMEIHELKQKWAFLKFTDIRDRIQSAEDLVGLGDITILIDDILMLSPTERQIVMDYIFATHAGATPMILVGVTSSIADLESQALVGKDWIKLMQHFNLDLDRLPSEMKRFKQSLELYFEPAFEV
jgi:hypothetical protein